MIFLEIHKNFLTPQELAELMSIIIHFRYKVIDVEKDCEIWLPDIHKSEKTEIRVLLI